MRQRSKNKLSTAVLVFVLMFLGIGYAYLNTTLSINGVTDVDSNSWDIHFDNVQVMTGSVTGSQVIDEAEVVDDTTVSFHVNLKEPGEFYEFTVDAVNDGTIDAMVSSISKKLNNVEITTLPAYLNYSVKYVDNIDIQENHLLEHDSVETYKIRIEYRNDIDPGNLPSSAQSLSLSFGVEYIQANNSAILVPRPRSFATDSWETIILAVQSGNTSAYNVGDRKTIELGNSLGNHRVRIANKSTPTECSNTGFSQTACGFVLEFSDYLFRSTMNPDNTNLGGWPATPLRTRLNNINDSSSVINSFPEVLRNAIIDTTVVSGHGPQSGETNYVSTDKLYLLSYVEVYGSNATNDTITLDDTRQLDYYASIPVTVNSTSGAIKSNESWWLRSASSGSQYAFWYIFATSGKPFTYNSYNSDVVSPAFRLG